MPERAEFYQRLAEHPVGICNEQVALPVLVRIENHHQRGGRKKELIVLIAALEPGTLLANVPISRLGSQFVVPVS